MHGRPTNLFAPASFHRLLALLWAATAVVTAFALSDATEGVQGAARFVAPVAWWSAVGAVVGALTVMGPLGLTVVRMVVPAAVPATVLVWAHGAGVALGAAATLLATLTAAIALSAEVGERMAQGAAYGEELRFPLRPPAAMLPPIVVTWVLWCAATLGAVSTLARAAWVPGVLLAVLAALLTWWLGQRFHRVSRRWLVLVPAGVVVHDQMLMGETLMVQRTNVAAARLALADSEAFDLTGPAGGHALDIAAHDMVLVVFPSTAQEPTGRAVHVQSFLVAPSRPGRALQAMAAAHLPVG